MTTKLIRQYPLLGSSANPEKLSESIRGLLILLLPIIIRTTGYDIPEESIIDFFDTGLIFWGACVSLYGLGRKLYYKGVEIYNIIKK